MPQTQPIMREATPADLPAILRLYEEAKITGEKALSVAEAEQMFDKLSRYPYYRVFVAVVDEEVVGTYEFLLMDNLAKAGAKSVIVEDVAVSPRMHKRGIGKAMMTHARTLARQHGAYKFALSSNDKRKDAHAFYDALGFARHGVSFVTEP